MNKFLLVLVLISLTSSCKKQVSSDAIIVPLPSMTPIVTPLPDSPLGGVTFEPVEYYTTKDQRAKIIKSGAKMNQVIQSQCFRDFMVNRKLIDTNGRTPEQVADHLQSLSGVIPVEMYDPGRFSSAVAYRSPPSLTIHLSYRYFNTSMSDCEWAATIAHESLGHSLGNYDHSYKWNLARSFSIPYSLGGADQSQGGSAFDKCCKE